MISLLHPTHNISYEQSENLEHFAILFKCIAFAIMMSLPNANTTAVHFAYKLITPHPQSVERF